jgi:hypothetical protein
VDQEVGSSNLPSCTNQDIEILMLCVRDELGALSFSLPEAADFNSVRRGRRAALSGLAPAGGLLIVEK